MNKIFILLLLAVIITTYAAGQPKKTLLDQHQKAVNEGLKANMDAPVTAADNNKKTDDAAPIAKSDLENFKTNLLNELQKRIEKEDTVQTGKLYLKKTEQINVYIHSSGKRSFDITGRKARLYSAMFLVQDGTIIDLQVMTDMGKFTNGVCPIGLTNLRFTQTDYLKLRNERGDIFYIMLKEIIGFNSTKNYIPDDEQFTLDTATKEHFFQKNVGINAVVDLRLYTDALGLFAKKDNGVAQIDVRAKYQIHQMAFKNTPLSVARYVKAYVNLSKFDSRSNTVAADAGFSRSQLLQKSWLTAEVSVNLLHTWLIYKSLSSAYLDFGTGLNVSTLTRDDDTMQITAPNFFLEAGALIKGNDNFGINLANRISWQYSPQTNFNGQEYARVFIRPSAEIYWNPFENKASRVFARFNYVFDTKNVAEKQHHFFQFQIGYSALISGLFK